MNVALAFGWSSIIISTSLTAVRIVEYYTFLDPTKLWAYNYCMHLPFVETQRDSQVEIYNVAHFFIKF